MPDESGRDFRSKMDSAAGESTRQVLCATATLITLVFGGFAATRFLAGDSFSGVFISVFAALGGIVTLWLGGGIGGVFHALRSVLSGSDDASDEQSSPHATPLFQRAYGDLQTFGFCIVEHGDYPEDDKRLEGLIEELTFALSTERGTAVRLEQEKLYREGRVATRLGKKRTDYIGLRIEIAENDPA